MVAPVLVFGQFGSCPSRDALRRNAPFASRSREGGALLTGAKLFDVVLNDPTPEAVRATALQAAAILGIAPF